MNSDSKPDIAVSEYDAERRATVLSALLAAIAKNERIELPSFQPGVSLPASTAFLSASIMTGPYSGRMGEFVYQFEGEEDLLHLIVARDNGQSITVPEGQAVARFLLDGVPPSLIWLKPGYYSQHFYIGHDDLAKALG